MTVLYAVPPIVNALARHPAVGDADLSSVRWIMSAAAPLDAETASACARRVGFGVFQAYGMTEARPAITATPPDDEDAPLDSVGIILPNTECKIVHPVTGQTLGPGEDGELLFRGPQIMPGYLDDPASTARAFDDEGFYRSGDVGRRRCRPGGQRDAGAGATGPGRGTGAGVDRAHQDDPPRWP